MLFTDTNIEKLQKVVSLFKKYDEIRDKTRLEKILAQEEKKFSDLYKEINLKRSNEINPLTTCAHGTNAAAVLSGIMFSGGQLLPLNGLKQDRVLDIHSCLMVGNQNFVSTVHLKNVQDLRKEFEKRGEKRKQTIDKADEITFTLPLSFALSSKSPLSKTIFLERIDKRCKGNENIYNDIFNALDDDVLKFFEELSKVPVLILGDGIGRYEGSDGLTLHWPRETLFKKFNVRIIAVKKEYRKFIEPLTKINTDFNIEIIDQEELLKFTKKYNAQFYDKSITDEENEYYNTECDNSTSESFMEALVNHFKRSLTFKKAEPVTITQNSIYSKKSTHGKGLGVVGRLDKISYCAEGLEERQKFYNENQIKNAIKKEEKIDDRDPIVYALLHGILLKNKFPIIYAMENAIKIEDTDPTLWAKKNKYDIEKKEPIGYAIEHAIKIEGKDPVLWAQKNKYKVDKIDPIVYAIKKFGVIVNKEVVYKTIKIEGKNAKEWISRAINNRRKIGDKDARKWLIDAIKEATEKGGFIPTKWRNYPSELVDCAEENNITLEGKPVHEWLHDKEAEGESPKDAPSPTVGAPTTNSTFNQQLPIKVPAPAIKQPQQGPVAEATSPTLGVHADDQGSTSEVTLSMMKITEVERPEPEAETSQQKPAVKVSIPALNVHADNQGSTSEVTLPMITIKEVENPEPEAEHSQEDPTVEVPSPTLNVHEEDSTSEEELPESVIALAKTDEETETQQSITDNGEQLQREALSPNYFLGDTHNQNQNGVKKEEKVDQQPNPPTDPKKSESNSKYYKIGGAGVGLAIGLAIAYFVGAAAVTPVLAAVAVFIGAAICGAVLGSAVGACLSCLLNPEVSNLSELGR